MLLGAVLATALAVQLWRTLALEASARAVELGGAEVAARRLLSDAQGSRAVFNLLPDEGRFVLGKNEVEPGDDVGWLEPVPAGRDQDLVVDDRLDRAARAEFVARDAAAAAREYDELLAGALQPVHRLQVLVAACWQARRANATERLAALSAELERRLDRLPAREVGRELVANAVAGAARLRSATDGGRPEWLRRLLPLLPDTVARACFDSLAGPRPEVLAEAQHRAARRRELARHAEFLWGEAPLPARQQAGFIGPYFMGEGWLLAWQPHGDGTLDGAVATTAEWLAAVAQACALGRLPAWPWLLVAKPYWAGVEEAAVEDRPEPWFVDLQPLEPPLLERAAGWLPLVTAVLLAVFGLAVASQFRAARREAAAVRAQAEFLTTVTHELKTPLASIRLLGEMLAEGRAQGREADYYKMLAGEAGRLSMLIENVLDLGRMERGERSYDLRAVDLAEVVAETVAMFAPVAERDGIAMVVHGDGAGPAMARADRGAVVQALISVLDNARKYGAEGKVIEVTTTIAPATFTVAVRDRGPGVPADERETIFERFVRGSAHAHGSVPGVGIGLYLARTIARRLGGDLCCGAPADGGPGAEFTIWLPLEEPA